MPEARPEGAVEKDPVVQVLSLLRSTGSGDFACDTSMTHTFLGDGTVLVDAVIAPGNEHMVLPRCGLRMFLDKSLDQVVWLGRGPSCSRMATDSEIFTIRAHPRTQRLAESKTSTNPWFIFPCSQVGFGHEVVIKTPSGQLRAPVQLRGRAAGCGRPIRRRAGGRCGRRARRCWRGGGGMPCR